MARSGGLIRRSDCLVFFFENGQLHCQNYLTGVEVESAPILVAILALLDRWRPLPEIERLFADYAPASVGRTLRELQDHTLVVEKNSDQAKREAALARWKPWGLEARFFHFVTKGAFRGVRQATDEARSNRALIRDSPQPDLIKRYPRNPRFLLPCPVAHLGSEFPRVLLARRTVRRFAPASISLDEFSLLLHLTWGVTGRIRWPGLGRLLLKTSPSGGARHPLEVYLWALRVEGLPRGIYHYRGDVHRLELLRPGASGSRVVKLCARQEWIGECAALFVMTAVFPRTMWRYRFSRAYRVILLEAGHFCQTFCLVATWLGLAPFCTAALLDEEIEEDLGLDGASESVLYAAGVGLRSGRARVNARARGFREASTGPVPPIALPLPILDASSRDRR